MIQRQTVEETEEENILGKPLASNIASLVQCKNNKPQNNYENSLKTKSLDREVNRIKPKFFNNINTLQRGGQSLSKSARNFFEPKFGYDFSMVRVHTDSVAAETARVVNAKAFILNNNIVFGAGLYAPDSIAGRKLLAHELTHVVQIGDAPQGINDTKGSLTSGRLPEIHNKKKSCSAALQISRQVDAGPPEESPEYKQLECLIQEVCYGSAGPKDMEKFNKDCKEKTGYTGEDISFDSAICNPGAIYIKALSLLDEWREIICDQNVDKKTKKEIDAKVNRLTKSVLNYCLLEYSRSECEKQCLLSPESQCSKGTVIQRNTGVVVAFAEPISGTLCAIALVAFLLAGLHLWSLNPRNKQAVQELYEKISKEIGAKPPKPKPTGPKPFPDFPFPVPPLPLDPKEKERRRRRKKRKKPCYHSSYRMFNKGAGATPTDLRIAACIVRKIVGVSRPSFISKNVVVARVIIKGTDFTFPKWIIGVNDNDLFHSEAIIIEKIEALEKIHGKGKVLIQALFSERIPCNKRPHKCKRLIRQLRATAGFEVYYIAKEPGKWLAIRDAYGDGALL